MGGDAAWIPRFAAFRLLYRNKYVVCKAMYTSTQNIAVECDTHSRHECQRRSRPGLHTVQAFTPRFHEYSSLVTHSNYDQRLNHPKLYRKAPKLLPEHVHLADLSFVRTSAV